MLIFKRVGVKVRWNKVRFYGFTIVGKAWLAVFLSSGLAAFSTSRPLDCSTARLLAFSPFLFLLKTLTFLLKH